MRPSSDDAVAAPGAAGEDHAVLVHDPGEVHLRDHFDDPGTADPRDRDASGGGEPGLVGPRLVPDDPVARLQGDRVDPHPLDGPRRGPLAAADLGALERRAGGARRREHPLAAAEHDLGIGADVHHEVDLVSQVRRLGEDHARGVGAHVPRHAGQDVGPRPRMQAEIEGARR